MQFSELYQQVKHDRIRDIMDMFLFAFHACGLRVSDIITLEWSHIDWEAKEISKNSFKGKVPHDIPLTEAAYNILKQWQAKNYNSRFVFDLLPVNFDINDDTELDTKRNEKIESCKYR